jgi:predicted kinase
MVWVFNFMKTNGSLILLRGLPGSGKSTLANLLSENGKYPMYSVDDYFTDAQTQEYHFDFKNNHLAYKQCEENTKEAILKKIEKIFVHNTFTMDWELEPYFKLAKQFNYSLYIITVEKYHQHKNLHDVSDEQLQKMAEKYKIKLY